LVCGNHPDRYLDAEVPEIPAAKPSARQQQEVGSDESEGEESEPPAQSSGRSKLQQKFYRMSSALCEVVDDYGLVSFHPMNVEDVEVRDRGLYFLLKTADARIKVRRIFTPVQWVVGSVFTPAR
jgi:hypothetical protein